MLHISIRKTTNSSFNKVIRARHCNDRFEQLVPSNTQSHCLRKEMLKKRNEKNTGLVVELVVDSKAVRFEMLAPE